MITKFVSDSSCDMWEVKGVNFSTAPLVISSSDEHFTDNEKLDISAMIDYLAEYKGRTYTACPNIDDWLSCFGDADRIYVVTMTSALSGTYNSAVAAKNIFQQDNPEKEIYIFDTLSTGPEQRLLIEKLIELDSLGLSFEEVCEKATQYLSDTRLFFALKSLHCLAQNGRVNKAVASAVGLLGISVFATASPEGTIQTISKCRSEKKVLSSLIGQMEASGYKGGKVRISHVGNPDLAEKLKNNILEKYPNADIITYSAHGLCSYYAEKGGILVGCECI